MLHALPVWCLVAAFLGAGLFNAAGTPATRAGFVRWGYPPWWAHVTGGLEVLAAGLIALPATRMAGLGLGAVIVAVAAVTVLRHRDVSHLVPLGAFAALLVLSVAL